MKQALYALAMERSRRGYQKSGYLTPLDRPFSHAQISSPLTAFNILPAMACTTVLRLA